MSDTPTAPKVASELTAAANTAASAMISFDDEADFQRAQQGLLATLPGATVAVDDHVVWDCARYDFLRNNENSPDTVPPGLWRQGRLNAIHGLFEVMDGVWQVRGYDISNLTLIAGRTGWILVDVLTTAATASACLKLANDQLGERPVKAIIYTHSHADHFGGVLGVTSAEEVAEMSGSLHPKDSSRRSSTRTSSPERQWPEELCTNSAFSFLLAQEGTSTTGWEKHSHSVPQVLSLQPKSLIERELNLK